MQIDWSFLSAVNWAEVAWFSGITFLAALVGNVLIFKYWFGATILAAVLFAAGYVFLVYYPHERPVPGLSTAPPKFIHAITAEKIPEAAPGVIADQWKHSLLQPTTICSAIRGCHFESSQIIPVKSSAKGN